MRPDGAITPDGRYFVIRRRLWRKSNPALSPEDNYRLVRELMHASRAVGLGKRTGDNLSMQAARAAVDHAKRQLGERGPVRWEDGAPDFNRYLASHTPYAQWWEASQS